MRFEFDIKKEYILEDECVLLRPLERDDFSHLLTFSVHEPEIWKYSLLQGGGEENLAKYIHQALTARDQGKEYPFIVFDKKLLLLINSRNSCRSLIQLTCNNKLISSAIGCDCLISDRFRIKQTGQRVEAELGFLC